MKSPKSFEFKGKTFSYEFRGNFLMSTSHPTNRETNDERDARLASNNKK